MPPDGVAARRREHTASTRCRTIASSILTEAIMASGAKPSWPRLRRPGLLAGVIAGVALYVVLRFAIPGMGTIVRLLLAWDAGVLTGFVALFLRLSNTSQEEMKRFADLLDAGKWFVLVLTLIAAMASLGAIAVEMPAARSASGAAAVGHAMLIIFTIVLSWALIHTVFAVHYAHDFYLEAAGRRSHRTTGARGMIFPGNAAPAYGDFLYFSFTIGMTFQVSDVQITDPAVRRVALAHAIASFFFATGILAMSINLVSGLYQ
jgi:uncharacterized membrane protein